MKKVKVSLFVLAAIVAGIAGSAFTAPIAAGPNANSFFEFDYAHYSPSPGNVQDESKWIMVSDLGTCNNSPTKACRIEVQPTYVSGSSLLSTANIGTLESSTNVAYVVSGNIATIRNKN